MTIYGDTTTYPEGTYDLVADLESRGHTLTPDEKRRLRERYLSPIGAAPVEGYISSEEARIDGGSLGAAPLPTGEDNWKQLLAYSADGIVQDEKGNKFKVNDDGTITTIIGGTTTVEKTYSPTDADDKYSKVLESLLFAETTKRAKEARGDSEFDFRGRTEGPSVSDLTYDPEDLPPSRYAGRTDPEVAQLVPKEEQVASYLKNKQALEAATLKERQKAQRKDVAGALGPAAILGGIDLAVQLLSKGEDEKYVDEELARLRKMQEDDEMGLSAEEKQFLVQAQMSPARGFAREERMRREAGEATMGGQISAADLERSRRAAQQGVAEVGRQAGMTIAQADMAKADQNLKRMEQMIAYKGARQKQKRAAVSSFTGALGAIYGDVAATGAVKPDTGTIRGIYGEAAKQGKLLSADEATKLMRQLRYSPRMNEQKVRDIFADAGLENVSDDFIASITRGSV